MKNLLEKIEESWKIIFLEFDFSLNKNIIDSNLKSKLTKLENSWKNAINQLKKQQKFSIQSFDLKEISENDLSKIFNEYLQKIQNQSYFKMYEEINNFLNINYQMIKILGSFSWKNMECSRDFFQILFNFSNFMKNQDFDEILYLKIIFKELYSLLDKYSMFFQFLVQKEILVTHILNYLILKFWIKELIDITI